MKIKNLPRNDIKVGMVVGFLRENQAVDLKWVLTNDPPRGD